MYNLGKIFQRVVNWRKLKAGNSENEDDELYFRSINSEKNNWWIRLSIGVPLTGPATKGFESVAQWISKWRNKNAARELLSGVGVNNGDVTAGRRTTKSDKTMACCLCFLSSRPFLSASLLLSWSKVSTTNIFSSLVSPRTISSTVTEQKAEVVPWKRLLRVGTQALFRRVKNNLEPEAFAWNRYTSHHEY